MKLGTKQGLHGCVHVHAQLCPTLCHLWAVANHNSPSIGFSRQEYWSGLPFPPPGDLPYPGIEPESPMSPALTGRFLVAESPDAAAASIQSCPTLCDPIDGSPPGLPSLGFSRQEHWSGLPFPSPMHESEK